MLPFDKVALEGRGSDPRIFGREKAIARWCQLIAVSMLIKYTRQAIDRLRETARRRVLYLCLPKKCYNFYPNFI